jgi:hypothetical protein
MNSGKEDKARVLKGQTVRDGLFGDHSPAVCFLNLYIVERRILTRIDTASSKGYVDFLECKVSRHFCRT